jgi:hypothetical protein
MSFTSCFSFPAVVVDLIFRPRRRLKGRIVSYERCSAVDFLSPYQFDRRTVGERKPDLGCLSAGAKRTVSAPARAHPNGNNE